MSLTKTDLKEIQKIVDGSVKKTESYLEDRIDYLIEKSEMRTEGKINKLEGRIDTLEEKMDRKFDEVTKELHDIVETNKLFLEKLSNHEVRITKLEESVA